MGKHQFGIATRLVHGDNDHNKQRIHQLAVILAQTHVAVGRRGIGSRQSIVGNVRIYWQ
ncbi:hypothetical protein [Loigolactobacillus zhaoyuanensis]|uniref:hypothetical protein n=1 Tax=Loigolactobacillus zhaoyuanensis TaxID=2486017 RepID=UPI0036295C90